MGATQKETDTTGTQNCLLPDNVVEIADGARFVKTSSSTWIKELDGSYEDFAWQDGYSSFSVSKSVTGRVKRYIFNQERHHHSQSYEKEVCGSLDQQGISYDERYLFD